MKRVIILLTLGYCIGCADTERSHTETAQIVVESFYQKDLPTLEKHTTKENFESFMYIQDLVSVADSMDSNFKIIQETENGNTAWVQFTTAYEEQPETFKLIKEDGNWKVTETGIRERGPF